MRRLFILFLRQTNVLLGVKKQLLKRLDQRILLESRGLDNTQERYNVVTGYNDAAYQVLQQNSPSVLPHQQTFIRSLRAELASKHIRS
jgi:hypothetical protein